MRVFISSLVLFLSIHLNAAQQIDSAFITTYEYGQMLYHNPRGIGCNKCHGENATGMYLSKYTTKDGKEITITAPDITNVTLEQFMEKLSSKSIKSSLIMPTYFLTQSELKSLYFYITSKEKK